MGGGDGVLDDGRGFGDGDIGADLGAAVDEFDEAGGEFLAEVDAEGDADQVGVLELDAGAQVAVVVEDVDVKRLEFGLELVGGVADDGVSELDGGEDDFERRDGDGEAHAVRVREEFDGGA